MARTRKRSGRPTKRTIAATRTQSRKTTKSTRPTARVSRPRSRTPSRSRTRRRTERATLPRVAQKIGRDAVAQMVPANAIRLLEQDHREAEAFFDQFETDEAHRMELARRICLALTVHAAIEEEIFYPAARQAGLGELLDEAEVEHAAAKQLIAEIDDAGKKDRLFPAKVKVLGEYVKHHIQEEEGKIFPLLQERELDLIGVGQQLAARRIALLIELGGRR